MHNGTMMHNATLLQYAYACRMSSRGAEVEPSCSGPERALEAMAVLLAQTSPSTTQHSRMRQVGQAVHFSVQVLELGLQLSQAVGLKVAAQDGKVPWLTDLT